MVIKPLRILVIFAFLVIAGVYLCCIPQQKAERALLTVGVVALTEVDAATLQGFKDGMQAIGYQEGENIRYLSEGPAGTIDRLDGIIDRILAKEIDLIFVSSTPATLKVQAATKNRPIPVIFDPVNDPVGAGIVNSLKNPGANITGIKLPKGEQLRLKWLTEIAPQAKQIYFPYNVRDKSALATLAEIEKALPILGLSLIKAPIESPETLETLITQLPNEAEAIFLPRDSSIEAKINHFVALANEKRIPISAPSLAQVEVGAHYTYGFIHYEFGKQAARLADQIFKGVHPSNIPVEVAKSYLVINVKAAEKIGLPLPDTLLRKADRIIR